MPTEEKYTKVDYSNLYDPNVMAVNEEEVAESEQIEETNLDTTEDLIESILFGQDSDIDNISLVSRMFLQGDVGEVIDLNAKFVYNYFQKNERVSNTQRGIINDSQTIEQEYESYDLEKLPMYVEITFKKPSNSSSNAMTNDNLFNLENFDKINFEKSMSNKFFTASVIRDVNSNVALYEILDASNNLIQSEQPAEHSNKDTIDKLIDVLNDPGGLTGQNKKYLIENFVNMKPSGLVFSKNDYDRTTANLSNNIDSKLTFGVKFNKLFIDEIIKSGIRINDTIYQDEYRAAIGSAESIQLDFKANLNDTEFINETDYMFKIDEESIASLSSNSDDNKFALAGYVIEKFETLNDGTTKYYDLIYMANPEASSYIDTDVRYGGRYIYKVKAVNRIISEVIILSEEPNDDDQIKFAKWFVGSGGVRSDVTCIERIPPKPPAGINIKFDFKNKIPVIHWNFPINAQRDIKRFQIFKRKNISSPYTLIAEYDFDDSLEKTTVAEVAQAKNYYKFEFPKKSFIDSKFKQGEKAIYALGSVDAHGLTSNLSAQYSFHYNKYQNKSLINLISRSGAPKQFPNIFVNKDTFPDVIKSSNRDRMNVFFDPEYYKVFKNTYTNESEGTGEEQDLKLIASNNIESTYSIQIVNIDIQLDKIINIRIKDASSNDFTMSPYDFLGAS
jgi:hypothetical protein